MWNLVKRILRMVGLKKRKEKYVVINGVRYRVVVEPYQISEDK